MDDDQIYFNPLTIIHIPATYAIRDTDTSFLVNKAKNQTPGGTDTQHYNTFIKHFPLQILHKFWLTYRERLSTSTSNSTYPSKTYLFMLREQYFSQNKFPLLPQFNFNQIKSPY